MSLPSPSPVPPPAHLGKGDEEELVVCVLEPVQRVLRAVLPHPLLVGLGCRAWGCYSHLPWAQFSTPSLHSSLLCQCLPTPVLHAAHHALCRLQGKLTRATHST